jgi:predicted nucleic acid-binding Zn ribbon protein
MQRLIGSGAGIIFKGSGFYETDYRSPSYQAQAKKEKDAAAGKGSSTSTKDSSDKKKKSEGSGGKLKAAS